MGILDRLFGAYLVEITSASIPDLIAYITASGITLHNIQPTDFLTVTAIVTNRDYERLCSIVIKRGDKVIVKQQNGFIRKLNAFVKRPVLAVGFLILVFLSLYLPTKVLFIEVEGNQNISSTEILESAEKCGIAFGASRREVRSERVKNALLSALPQLQWAGINTNGCVAVISVKERSSYPEKSKENTVSSIIAARDGIIREMTVLQGSPQCKVGQAAKKGQVLVSGYTDCGITIRAERADAEIIADTIHNFKVVSPILYSKRIVPTHKESEYMLVIGKKLIKLRKDSGIFDTSCVKMYEKIPVTLPGGFVLPISVIKIQYAHYESQPLSVEETELNWLPEQADTYLQNQMISGRILSRNESISVDDDEYLIDYKYSCREMIGTVRYEELIAPNE